ncbi:hypothetical protein MLD38_024594 [Melastoma candidum]|uniref:Uncharacterized protein n=1 Tax=Melastoma candidum TaxID=119954 RepID=A0ACB9NUC7_9MYRT|nr:hypothetical protein MLD38_024594 [Melastoma candidum]
MASGRTGWRLKEQNSGNATMSLEPTSEEREKFHSNLKVIPSSLAALPLKVPQQLFPLQHLGTGQDVQDAEHQQVRESGKAGENLSWSEVNNMPYTLKVISETLRRATVLAWFSRKATQDFEIDGYKIQKGRSLNLDVVSIHNNPEYFPRPELFNPSQFNKCVFIHHLVGKFKWTTLEKDDSLQPTLVRMPKNKYPVLLEPP